MKNMLKKKKKLFIKSNCSQVSALWGKCGSTGLKLRPIVTEKRKLREVVRKRGKVLLYPYFHP